MTDTYTDELFSLPDAATVCYPVSRLVADPERFADDAEEVMTKVGWESCTRKRVVAIPSDNRRVLKSAMQYSRSTTIHITRP